MRRIITVGAPTKVFPSPPAALPGIPAPGLTASVISTSEIDLTATYSGPPNLATYSFYSSPTLSGPYTLLATQAGATYANTGLSASQTVFYFARINTAEAPSRTSMPSAIVSATTNGSGVSMPAMPIFGFIATQWNASQAEANRLARSDIVTIGASFEGAGNNPGVVFGGNLNGYVTYLQGQSLCNTRVLAYYIADSMGNPGVNGWPSVQSTIIDPNNWNLYCSGTAGTKTGNYFDHSKPVNNVTTYTPVDGNGHHVEDAIAMALYHYWVVGDQGWPNQAFDKMPTIAGLWHDNFNQRTPLGGQGSANGGSAAADWNRDGTPDFQNQSGPPTGAAIDQAYRNGLALGCNWIHAHTSLLYFGNIAGWGPNGTFNNGEGNAQGGSNVTGIDGILDGGMWENCLGNGASPDSYAGLSATVADVSFAQAHVKTSWMVTPGVYWGSDGLDFVTAAAGFHPAPAWQGPRYQVCACWVMGACPYLACISPQNYNVMQVTWLDELCVNPSTFVACSESTSTTGKGYLGVATDAYYTKLSNGVYAVRFFNSSTGKTGVVFCNDINNGPQTFTIATFFPGKTFQAISGTQAPSVNDGATHASITLAARDGRVGWLV